MNRIQAEAALASIGLGAHHVAPILGGWAFWTFDVDDNWIVRFPRTAASAAAATRELLLLPELALRLPFPVPNPSHRGTWNGWPFFAYPKIPGRGLGESDGSAAVFTRLGEMIGELHSVPVDRAAELLGIVTPARAWRFRLERLWPDIETIAMPHMSPDVAARVMREFDGFVSNLPELPASLIHNDLGLEHLLVNESTGWLQGIIDFESAWIGDPAIDFVPLAATFGKEALRVILRDRDLGPMLDDRLWFYRWMGSIHAIIHGVTQDVPGV